MEFFEVINKRRSVRKFNPTPVPEAVVRKALDAALVAPNSSNMQPWEFYWVRSPEKKAALIKSAFNQGAARTAAEILVAVSRIDTWKRNRKLMLEWADKSPDTPQLFFNYYRKLVPVFYTQGLFNLIGALKWIVLNVMGLFRPSPRGPASRAALFEVVTKTTALACENIMLSIVAQGYGCCPMEGFDEARVKRLLGLNRHCHVVMLIGIGEVNPKGIYGPQIRFDKSLFIHEV